MLIRDAILKFCLLLMAIIHPAFSFSQPDLIYKNLPVGKYAVGFKIVTLPDETRIVKPAFNYLGEKNEGDRRRIISMHIWYPANAAGKTKNITYGEYCYNHLRKTTSEAIDKTRQEEAINSRRRSVENWFGKTTDDAWTKLINTQMLAGPDAQSLKGKFPLLIGSLRSLSTSVTNELLASNGYVVVMLETDTPFSFALSALEEITDMRFVLPYLEKNANIDTDKIGTFGFSGSGFSQVLFAMNDYRVKAVADIESGIYMDGLFQNFSSSNYYIPSKLRVPFLHIFSRDLSKQEKFIDDFYNKTLFAKRYRLVLNQPALHHWDFACEGYTSTIFLNNRGEHSNNIRLSFEIASVYLLNFFNAELKNEKSSQDFLTTKPVLPQTADSLWSIEIFNASKPAPNQEELNYIIRKKGIDEAIALVKSTIKKDTLTDLLQWYSLNGLGYGFINERKYKEAIELFKLNIELHPNDPNLFDSLAEGYELSGDKENMMKMSATVIDLLSKKESLSDAEKGLKTNAEKRLR